MARRWINFVEGTLASGLAAGATTLSYTKATSSATPVASSGDPLYLVIDPEAAEHPPEIVKCTGVSGSGPYTLTIVRNQESSGDQTWDTGRKVVAAVSAAAMTETVTLGDAQTVTGAKTFSAAAVTSAGLTVGQNLLFTSTPAYVQTTDGGNAIEVVNDGAVTLCHNTSGRLATSAAGVTVTGDIAVTGTVDGVDISGIEAGATADQSASEILTAIKTVDGAGTGLDADLLDAQEGSYYLAAANITGATLASGVTASSLTSVGTLTAVNTAGAITFTALTGTPTITGSGEVLRINARQFDIANEANSELLIQCNQNADVILYHDNIGRVATTSAGATVTGDLTVTNDISCDDLTVADEVYLTATSQIVWDTTDDRAKVYVNTGNWVVHMSRDAGASYVEMVRIYRHPSNQLLNKADFAANLEPTSDDTFDLGSTAKYWDDVFATNPSMTSDATLKTDVADSALGLDFINDLRPVSFKWGETKGRAGVRTHHGFLAQEVAATLGSAASDTAIWVNGEYLDEDGATQQGSQALRYHQFTAPLVKAVQELTARIVALEAA